MAAFISCTPTAKGVHGFYIEASGETHFLFSQDYRRGVNKYFRDGVRLDDALNFSRAKGDCAIERTMEKLPSYIKYIEREYDLEILRKTAKKNAKHNRRAA
jgi:hypothetical protein